MFPDKFTFTPKLLLPGGELKLTVLLPLNPVELEIPPEVIARAKTLNIPKKTEIHITVVGFAGSKILNKAVNAGIISITDIQQILDSYTDSLEVWQTLNYYIIEKTYTDSSSETIPPGGQYRQTIINLIYSPAIESLIYELNAALEKPEYQLPMPYLHATLFSTGHNLQPELVNNPSEFINPAIGIGLNSEADFKAASPQKIYIENPEKY